jgi:antitoxin (DNA-binding transcriptional repressor) of toxin-antitoxin stability system
MFQGLAVEYLNAHEADGSPIETTQDGVVVAHLVPLLS